MKIVAAHEFDRAGGGEIGGAVVCEVFHVIENMLRGDTLAGEERDVGLREQRRSGRTTAGVAGGGAVIDGAEGGGEFDGRHTKLGITE